MKIKEFLNATPAELITRRTNMKHEVMNLRLQQKSGQMENTARLKNLRRAIARIETVLSNHRHTAAAK